MNTTPTKTDIVGLIACLPFELGGTPPSATLVVAGLDGQGRLVASATLPLLDALAGAPGFVADGLRAQGAMAAVVIAYHEATVDAVAQVATHMGLALNHRGLDVVGVAQVGFATDSWRRMSGWADDDGTPTSGRYSELADHPAQAQLRAQDEGWADDHHDDAAEDLAGVLGLLQLRTPGGCLDRRQRSRRTHDCEAARAGWCAPASRL
ncbi:hypothetical protein [Cutibacterium avidum]|uniref:hypothetical protein n=1 Tax=Cutibacterium avidum TaxID=33010 RepID=UPI0003A72B90